jgi:hypothetical protein
MPAGMTIRFARTVLASVRLVVGLISVSAAIVAATAGPAAAQSVTNRAYTGPYAGIEVGRQHVIAGSLVDEVDTVQDGSRAVATVFGGLRGQVGRVVVGGELGLGRMDGNLRLDDPSRDLVVNYAGDSQWHWGLHAGYVVRPGSLLFGYLSEVTREFDVTVERSGSMVRQQDEPGLLRFGAGVEQQVSGPFRLRATLGTARADFGGRETNVDIGRRLDLSLGLVVQF